MDPLPLDHLTDRPALSDRGLLNDGNAVPALADSFIRSLVMAKALSTGMAISRRSSRSPGSGCSCRGCQSQVSPVPVFSSLKVRSTNCFSGFNMKKAIWVTSRGWSEKTGASAVSANTGLAVSRHAPRHKPDSKPTTGRDILSAGYFAVFFTKPPLGSCS